MGFYRVPARERTPYSAREIDPVVLVTGATGFIGKHLVRRLHQRGEAVIVLTRNWQRAWRIFGPSVRIVQSLDEIPQSQRIATIINLAGARIFGWPWTRARKRVLMQSRLRVTEQLIALIDRLQEKPCVLVNASAIGFYGLRDEEEISEADRGQPIFQSHLCQAWEVAARRAERSGVRVCMLRFGLVLGADGGVLPQQSIAGKLRLAIILGSGRQWVSWIHITDAIALLEHCMDQPEITGALNATAPQPVRQAELAVAMVPPGSARLRVAVPERLLRCMLGEMAQLLVDGQRVRPLKAFASGFTFRYPSLQQALNDLLFSQRSKRTREELLAQPAARSQLRVFGGVELGQRVRRVIERVEEQLLRR